MRASSVPAVLDARSHNKERRAKRRTCSIGLLPIVRVSLEAHARQGVHVCGREAARPGGSWRASVASALRQTRPPLPAERRRHLAHAPLALPARRSDHRHRRAPPPPWARPPALPATLACSPRRSTGWTRFGLRPVRVAWRVWHAAAAPPRPHPRVPASLRSRRAAPRRRRRPPPPRARARSERALLQAQRRARRRERHAQRPHPHDDTQMMAR